MRMRGGRGWGMSEAAGGEGRSGGNGADGEKNE